MTPEAKAVQGRKRLIPSERREALIDATIKVVAERGYEHASFSIIAERAGVSKGLIWHYFSDGDDLMLQTARTTLVNLRNVVSSQLDLTASVPEIIRAGVVCAAALTRTHSDELAAMNMIVFNLRDTNGKPLLDVEEYDETYSMQELLFARGQKEGFFCKMDTRIMAVTYQGAVDAMLVYLQKHPNVSTAEYANVLADILFDGFSV